ncbi:MAG: pectinesterase family protein [Verrucomicrobiota bacterium]
MKHPLFPALALALVTQLHAANAPQPDLVVAADGSGNFKTIQAALESIPATNHERVVVFVKDGVYREKLRVDASFVTLRGESRKGTRIEFPQLNDDFTAHPDQLGRAVININHADDFVLENLTAENTAGVIGPHSFTVYGTGDRTVVVDCDILSHGADTISLWLGDRGRYYHARCRFTGSVDFICPRGWCYVTDCTFYEWKNTAATWHDGSRDQDMKFVLRRCQFDGTNGWNLARHHVDAQFYYLDCTFAASMRDRAPFRVIYPLSGEATAADRKRNQELDPKNLWGERAYFWNCHRDGGDYAWHSNNLASAAGAPKPEQITAAWTFAGKWNPENPAGPVIRQIKNSPGHVQLIFNEAVTVKGKPQVRLANGTVASFAAGSGSDTLSFAVTESDKPSALKALELNGGAIIANEASASLRLAELALPK